MKNRKVFSSLLNEGNKTFLKNKKTSNTISIDKLVPILNDNLSISNLKKIKVTNNFVDVDVNEYLIENYENRINGQSQKIISNFAQFSNTKVDRHRKLTLRSLWKQYKTENIEFLELLNDVIFNVEVDWNDKFNYSCGFNLFNTKLTHKAVEVKKNNSIVIEKPLEVKINKDVNWNDNLIKSIINEEEKEKISNKKQIDELKKMSSIEISQLIKKYIYILENLDGYIYSLENLYYVIATKKPTKLAISLYRLISLLKHNSVSVQNLISMIPNFNSLAESSDFELINQLEKSIDRSKILNLLNSEILKCKSIYDANMNLYTLAQQVSYNIFLTEINAAIDYSSGKTNKKDKSFLIVQSSDEIANTNNINSWRNALYKFIHKMSKNNTNNELFIQLNNEIGIINDLKQLHKLLNEDFDSKLSNKNILYKTNYHDIELYCLKESINLNRLSSSILLYKLINFHFNLILLIQEKLEKSNLSKDWSKKYLEWFDSISKSNSKKNQRKQDGH